VGKPYGCGGSAFSQSFAINNFGYAGPKRLLELCAFTLPCSGWRRSTELRSTELRCANSLAATYDVSALTVDRCAGSQAETQRKVYWNTFQQRL